MMSKITIERAKLSDVDEMKAILDDFAEGGELLARSRMDFYEKIRDFYVARVGGVVAGMVALHVSWVDLAEIRSLAVAHEFQSRGIGSLLAKECMEDALSLGVDNVFTLTYRPGFFERFGFEEVSKAELPHKVWKVCLDCVKFPDCDEIAMMTRVK